jgi:DNA-binding phage protein
MANRKTSRKQKKSSKPTMVFKKKKRAYLKSAVATRENNKEAKIKHAKLIPYSPTQELLDEKFIALAIWECFKNNDPEGVIEVIQAHLEVVNKSRAAKEIDLPRSSMYNAIKGKNPTIKTLAKIINCCEMQTCN